MGNNPLLKNGKLSQLFTGRISAWDWARMAKDKGLPQHAKAWEEAARNGWDQAHYRPDPQ